MKTVESEPKRLAAAVTIHDVARHADVSTATASRALTGSRRVSPDLVTRVNEAARVLGYRHNAIASALRQGRTKTIGMIVPEISNPFFPTIVEAIERRLQENGRDLFLCDARQDTDTEQRRTLALIARQVDGLIIVPVSATTSRISLEEAVGRGIPVVQVDRYVEGFPADWVGVDDTLGISLAVEHVASLGARRCAFVSATSDSSSGLKRLVGFEKAAARMGLLSQTPPHLGSFTAEWGRAAASQMLENSPPPDAVVCGNDEIAIGLLSEFRRRHVRVPEDVKVTGFDDIRFASLTDPPLTSVGQPHALIASECVGMLDQRIADPSRPTERTALAPSLIIRESTGEAS